MGFFDPPGTPDNPSGPVSGTPPSFFNPSGTAQTNGLNPSGTAMTNTGGHYTSADIGALWKQLTGRDATDAEKHQWGDNIDETYFQAIQRQIAATDEAKTYATRSQTPGAPAAPTSGSGSPGTNWATADYSDPNTVKAYFQSRGVQLSDQTANYWAQKYNSPEFAGDRNYFFQRLGQDPAITGNSGGGDYTAPWNGKYTPPTFTPPPAFQAPDPSKVFDDPSFKFRMGEGLKALDRSAASKGTLLTGNTLQDEQAFGQNMATSEYDKIYGRAVSQDQTQYGRALGEYGIARDNSLAQYQDQKGTYYDNQDRPFNKLMQYAGMGSNALNASNQFSSQYVGDYLNSLNQGTNGANGYYTGGAAAGAGGIVGSQNAQSQAWQNMMQQWAYLFGGYQGQNGGGMRYPSFNQPNQGNS